jgi:hypothetical protein
MADHSSRMSQKSTSSGASSSHQTKPAEARWLGPRTVLLKQEYEAADQEAEAPPETYVQMELPR